MWDLAGCLFGDAIGFLIAAVLRLVAVPFVALFGRCSLATAGERIDAWCARGEAVGDRKVPSRFLLAFGVIVILVTAVLVVWALRQP